jgi:hypothetical protein
MVFHKDTGQPPRYRYCFALKGVTRGGRFESYTRPRSDVKRWWETANAPETGLRKTRIRSSVCKLRLWSCADPCYLRYVSVFISV